MNYLRLNEVRGFRGRRRNEREYEIKAPFVVSTFSARKAPNAAKYLGIGPIEPWASKREKV